MHLIVELLILLSASCGVLSIRLDTVYEWNYIEYQWPSTLARQQAIDNGSYHFARVLPMDVDVSRDGRVFVSFLGMDGVPATLGVVSNQRGPSGPLIQPYPNLGWFKRGSCNAIQNVYRIAIDECNRLWVLDTGYLENTQPSCEAQLLVFNLNTDQLITRIKIPNNIARNSEGDTLLANPIIETYGSKCEDTTAYLADPVGRGLIVWKNGRLTRLENPIFNPNPNATNIVVGNRNMTLRGGIVAMDLSPQIFPGESRFLYFHSMASYDLYYADTASLKRANSGSELRFQGQRNLLPSNAPAHAFASDGTLFTGLTREIAIACWNRYNPMRRDNMQIVAQDRERLQYVNGLKVIPATRQGQQEELWVIANRFIAFQQSGLDVNDVNFRIMKKPVKELTRGTKCQLPRQTQSNLQDITNQNNPQLNFNNNNNNNNNERKRTLHSNEIKKLDVFIYFTAMRGRTTTNATLLCACIFAITLTNVSARARLDTIFEWRYINYTWDSDAQLQDFMRKGYYEPAQILPMDVDVSRDGRVFIAMGGRSVGVSATLGVVTNVQSPSGPLIMPYPNWSWFEKDNCNSLTNVYRIAIDECNRMWVLDAGFLEIPAGTKNVCEAQLVVFDLNTDTLLQVIKIPDSIAKNQFKVGMLANPIVETSGPQCEYTTVYMADVLGEGLVVYNDNKIFRLSHSSFLYDSSLVNVTTGKHRMTLGGGILGMDISPRLFPGEARHLYYRPLVSLDLFAVHTSQLRGKEILSGIPFATSTSAKNILTSHAVGQAFSSEGTLFLGMTKELAIGCWNRYRALTRENFEIIAQDDEQLEYANGVKVIPVSRLGAVEELWVLTNRFIGFQLGKLEENEVNFRVLKKSVRELVEGTRCELPEYTRYALQKIQNDGTLLFTN
ncbi:hypothetical protein TKK_0001296 [Trichogramma kaykai]